MKLTYVAAICSSQQVSAMSLSSEGHWDTPKINNLIQSTTNLIRDSMTSKVTTAIQRFAEATIEKIENEVIPKLLEAHKADQEYLAAEFAKFGTLNDTMHAQEVTIGAKTVTCNEHSRTHTECRDEESTIRTEETTCETTKEELKKQKEICEDILSGKETVIDTLWCTGVSVSDDPAEKLRKLSEDFFTQSKVAMEEYMKKITVCSTETEEWESETTKCETITETRTTKTTECNSNQEEFEECTCQRANLVDDLKNQYILEWGNMTTLYIESITWKNQSAVDRIEEYTGLHIVKCLLEQVKALGLQNGPCNESHVKQVEEEIQKCKTEEHNTTHLTFTSKEVPHVDITLIFQQKSYPCSDAFLAEYYGDLPANTAHSTCNDHWCNVDLRHG